MTQSHDKLRALIFLAKRFNTAYYLLLNAGDWSGGETRGWLTLLGVVETRQIVGLRISKAEGHCFLG